MFHIAIVNFTKVQYLQKLPLTQFRRSLKNFRLTLVWEIFTCFSRFRSYIYSKKTRQCGREDKRERNLELYSDKALEIFTSSLPSTGTIFLRLVSKADHTTTTNTHWSTESMKAPRPTNLTTYWLASVSLAPACLSPHTTLAQLSHTSSRVSWACLKSMVIWWTFIRDCIGEVHFKDGSKPDEVTKLVTGDVVHIDEGSHNTLTAPNKAKRKNKLYMWWILPVTRSTLLPQYLVTRMLHRIFTRRTSVRRNNSVAS